MWAGHVRAGEGGKQGEDDYHAGLVTMAIVVVVVAEVRGGPEERDGL